MMKTLSEDNDYSEYPGYYVVQSIKSPGTYCLYYGVEKIAEGSKEEMDKQLIEEIRQQKTTSAREVILLSVLGLIAMVTVTLESIWQNTPGG